MSKSRQTPRGSSGPEKRTRLEFGRCRLPDRQGRPPVEHQWKPNQSGNKKGRKKGSKNRKTIVQAAERKTFTVKKAGRPRKITATEVGLHNLQQDVLRGDRKAFLDYLEIIERYGDQDETTASMQELVAEDHAILANYASAQGAQAHHKRTEIDDEHELFDQRMLDMALRTDFISFIHKVVNTVNPASPYLDNWHVWAIAWHLEQVLSGNIRRLIICLPPRSLKSIISSVAFPAWALGSRSEP